MIKNVIFDLDGTLLDTREGILESVRFAAKKLGYVELPQDTLLHFVGPPIQQSFMTYYGCSKEKAQTAAEIFRDYYKRQALLKAEPYDRIYEACDMLKSHNVRMAVATYKREDYALRLLRYYHFDKYCDPMHGADNNNILRKEDIVRLCLEEMGADAENSVLVGDTVHDAEGADRAGIPFLAVTYGFGFKETKDIAVYPHIGVAASAYEVAEIILEGDNS